MNVRSCCISLICLILCTYGSAQLPDDFSDQVLSEDWVMPMGLTFDETGRMFVWEKSGRVFIVDTTGQKLSEPLIDIQEEVGNWRDHGLLGFALDPDFLANGHYYMLYAVDRHHLIYYGTSAYHQDSSLTHQASIGRLTRYTADPATNFQTTLPNSRKILIGASKESGIPLYHESHGVGTLLFGEDGTLLLSCGDGNSNLGADIGGSTFGSYTEQALDDNIISADQDIGSFKAMYPGSLNGKVLRIDPETGEGLASNPFYDPAAPKAAQSRVWATGFRNPFRMILQENTGSHNPEDGNPGKLFVGDVGASQWEELNIIERGGENFGWPLKEGLIPHWGFWNSNHPPNQLAINPLAIGNSCPEYFSFKDLFAEARAEGTVFFPNPCDPTQPIPETAFPRMETIPVLTWGHNEWNLPTKTYIGIFDTDGALNAVDITSSASPVESDLFDGNSSIAGLFYNGDNFPDSYSGKYFHADYSGWIKVLHFDENQQLTRVEPFHEESKQVIHMAVHPIDGCIYYLSFKNGGSIHKICYGGNPPPVAIAKADTLYGPSPLEVTFDGSESYDPFDLPITYHWEFGDGTSSDAPITAHTFNTVSNQPMPFQVRLTVTDSLGVSSSSELTISLNNTPPVVEIISPKPDSYYSMNGNTIYTLEAEVFDQEHEAGELQYQWQTFLHHNTHFHPEAISTEQQPLTLISPVGCEDNATYWFRIQLTITDPAGLHTTKESEIFPHCGPDFFEIGNFNASANKENIALDWDVILEEDVLFYEVQRNPFINSIGRLESIGPGAYQFIDKNPDLGSNQYRIKAIRGEDIFDYSEIVQVDFPLFSDIEVYPNPATKVLHIQVKETQGSEVNLQLYDLSGKHINSINWPVDIGEPFEASILTYTLANGVYFYKVTNGSESRKGQIVILN